MGLLAAVATDTTAEITKEVSQLSSYLSGQLPALINFGIKVLFAIVCFFIGSKLIKWARKLVRRSIERTSADKGVEQFVDSLLKFILYIILIFSIATKFGVESTSVAALLASGGVAIGLALQGSLSNFAGGVLILLLKPFVVGDYIIEDNHKNEGTVKEIQIFYTKLSTVDNKTIVIPNGTLANNSLTNVTAMDKRRLDLTIGIGYECDLKKAKELIRDLLVQDTSVLKNEEILVFVDQLSDHAVVIGMRAWVKMEEYWEARWRMLEVLKLTLDENHISISYQQITVHMEHQRQINPSQDEKIEK